MDEMVIQKCFALIALATLLGGCASFGGRSSEESATFTTRITDDGTKLFDYTVYPSLELTNAYQLEGKGWKAPWNDIDHLIYTMLDNKIAMTGYCRDGFIELNSNFSEELYQVSGECFEVATAEDRTYFTVNR